MGRTLFAGSLIALNSMAFGQVLLMDPFESGGMPDISAWQYTLHPPASVQDAPVGGGTWSLGANPDVPFIYWEDNRLFTRFFNPSNVEGYHVEAWMRREPGGTWQSASFAIGLRSIQEYDYWYDHDTTGIWTFVTVDHAQSYPDDSLQFVLYPGIKDTFSPSFYRLFDQVQVTLLSTTDVVDDVPHRSLPHRPDPATDKLWVHMEDPVTNLRVIDAAGRLCEAPRYIQQESTVELDIGYLQPGLYNLLLTSNKGQPFVRFVKE